MFREIETVFSAAHRSNLDRQDDGGEAFDDPPQQRRNPISMLTDS